MPLTTLFYIVASPLASDATDIRDYDDIDADADADVDDNGEKMKSFCYTHFM